MKMKHSVADYKHDMIMIGIYVLLIGFALGWVTAQSDALERCDAVLSAEAQRR
jgi:hypothetical protein